jgi:hypothetical protein
MASTAAKLCFVICPIGEADSDARKHSNKVLRHIIEKALAPGYRVVRGDQISDPGLITAQIIDHVLSADLVVADLSGSNANVFYELALRHAVRKPVVHLIRIGDRIPFDVHVQRAIPFDITDPDTIEDAVAVLMKQVAAFEAGKLDIETPLSAAIDLQALRQSDKVAERSLGTLLDTMNNLATAVQNLEQRAGAIEGSIVSAHTSAATTGAGLLSKYLPALERETQLARLNNPAGGARRGSIHRGSSRIRLDERGIPLPGMLDECADNEWNSEDTGSRST